MGIFSSYLKYLIRILIKVCKNILKTFHTRMRLVLILLLLHLTQKTNSKSADRGKFPRAVQVHEPAHEATGRITTLEEEQKEEWQEALVSRKRAGGIEWKKAAEGNDKKKNNEKKKEFFEKQRRRKIKKRSKGNRSDEM